MGMVKPLQAKLSEFIEIQIPCAENRISLDWYWHASFNLNFQKRLLLRNYRPEAILSGCSIKAAIQQKSRQGQVEKLPFKSYTR
jgi:hypothetical protein